MKYPCNLGHEEINKETALMRAASYSDLKSVELLIAAGANVAHVNSFGFTALHCAARGLSDREGNPKIIECLVMEGANPDAINVIGITPLSWAIKFGHSAVEKELRKYGAQIEKEVLPCIEVEEENPSDLIDRNIEAKNDELRDELPDEDMISKSESRIWWRFWKR